MSVVVLVGDGKVALVSEIVFPTPCTPEAHLLYGTVVTTFYVISPKKKYLAAANV